MGGYQRNSIIRTIIFMGALLLCLGMAPISLAADYEVITINPPAGYDRSRAQGINNSGQVVGRFYNYDAQNDKAIDRQAFIWDAVNGIRALPTLSGESSAWGINDNGWVSGYSYDGNNEQKAIVWDTANGDGIIYIGTLDLQDQVSGDTSTAYDLNNQGQVVGNADIPNDSASFLWMHAFLFDQTNGIQDLGTLTTDFPQWKNGYSIAYDINNNGEAVGIAYNSSLTYSPFIYRAANGMQALNRDPNRVGGEWYAVVINDSGLIGGHVIVANNQSLPYYWPDSSSDPVQIPMPAGFPYGEIYGINASGEMVGLMWNSDQAGATEHAFIFDPQNGVWDLNDLIDPQSGWVLTFARDINDAGQIVGYGELNGEKRGFILDPITLFPPSAPTLVSPANGSSQAGTSVTFGWDPVAEATGYTLYVRDSSTQFVGQSVGKVTSFTVTGLPNDGREIFWRVYPYNPAGMGTASERWSFFNGYASPPSAPTLLSPANGSYQAGTSVTFSWDPVAEAIGYTLYVRDSSTQFVGQSVGKVTSFTVTGLPNDGREIFWRVYPYNPAGMGTASERWSFFNSGP